MAKRHEKKQPKSERQKQKLPDETVDHLMEVFRKADELLGDKPEGDEHYPGEVNSRRVTLKNDLPRRT